MKGCQISPRLAVLLLTLGGCARPGSVVTLTEELRSDITAAAIALDERWGQAAARGDVDGALGSFLAVEGFSFAFDGGLVSSFEGFEELVRRSYSARAGLETENLERQVLVVSPDVAMLTGRSRATVIAHDGTRTTAELRYGSLCTKVGDEWKIVHAYEFAAR